MPRNVVYVGRPTIYGNPFPIYVAGREYAVEMFRKWWEGRGWINGRQFYPDQMALLMGAMFQTEPHPLKGKSLACWCPLNEPCHADVLLEIANT
jgi:hypothetical protein